MKVTREKTENSQAFLTIEMEPAELEKSMEVAYHHLVAKAKIPGFRKGKAPRAVLERYLGRERLIEDAIDHLVPEAYDNALKEQKIESFAQPQIEITQAEPVIFKAVVPLPPSIELADYHHIQVQPKPVEVKEDEVAELLEGLRHQHATWEPVERPVAFNDLVVLDVESTVDGKPFLNQNGVQYQVIRDLASPVPGFAEQLPGINKGETKEFKLTFPADYPREGLAGKESAFKVKVIEIKQEKLPELNDELAKQVNPEFNTLEKLREQVATNLKLRAEEKARMEFEEEVVKAVVALAKVEFPPVLIEMEVDRLINEQARRLQLDSRGLEEYLKGLKKTAEELRADLRPIAVNRVTSSLVLGKVAEMEKIEVSDAEIDSEAGNILKGSADKDKDEIQRILATPQSRDSFKRILMTRKTLERLVETAKAAVPAEAQKEEKK